MDFCYLELTREQASAQQTPALKIDFQEGRGESICSYCLIQSQLRTQGFCTDFNGLWIRTIAISILVAPKGPVQDWGPVVSGTHVEMRSQ